MTKLTIKQINKSHSNFVTKQDEIANLIKVKNADICIVYEANTGGEEDDDIVTQNLLFDKLKFEEKYIFQDKLSRIVMIINADLEYTRRQDLENNDTPCIVIQIKLTPRKSLYIVGYYQQWRLIGANNLSHLRIQKTKLHASRNFEKSLLKLQL